jgi:hypothetical protein
MTRNAAPLPPSPRRCSIDIGTPSRKRPREIAASDACSSNEPISPHKSRDSTPRRSAKRLCTPLSEGRRQSAPSNLQRSPLKPLDPNKMLALDNLPDMPLKKEKKVSRRGHQVFDHYLIKIEYRTGMGTCWTRSTSFEVS